MGNNKYPTTEAAIAIVDKLRECFPQCSICEHLRDFIQVNPLPKFQHVYNWFIKRDGSTTEQSIMIEMISKLSGFTYNSPISPKSVDGHSYEYIRDGINKFLGTNLTERDFQLMYQRLNHTDAAIRFINSGFSSEYLEEKNRLYLAYFNY